jgi:Zn-dependent protease
MFSLLFSDPVIFLITALGLLISLTVHEFAHAWTADRLGDSTPRLQGRVTLNPLAHLDPLGTILLLVTHFGWGKPVQFNPSNLENPVRDGALIALAGPGTNLLIAGLLSVIFHLNIISSPLAVMAIIQVALINIVLAIFNLIPVHPLDGSKIILPLLPRNLAIEYEYFMHKYGMFVLLALILPWYQGTSPVSALIQPLINVVGQFLFG